MVNVFIIFRPVQRETSCEFTSLFAANAAILSGACCLDRAIWIAAALHFMRDGRYALSKQRRFFYGILHCCWFYRLYILTALQQVWIRATD
jgi:hypothetical protein